MAVVMEMPDRNRIMMKLILLKCKINKIKKCCIWLRDRKESVAVDRDGEGKIMMLKRS